MHFNWREVRVACDGHLALEDAIKQAIIAEFQQDRAWADANVDVNQLLKSNSFIDMGSAVMFGMAMDARSLNLFITEWLGRRSSEAALSAINSLT